MKRRMGIFRAGTIAVNFTVQSPHFYRKITALVATAVKAGTLTPRLDQMGQKCPQMVGWGWTDGIL